jgi:cobalamin biosynthesis Mg chelatase CobN
MKKNILFVAFLIFCLGINSASATMTCDNCQVNDCTCAITDCANGGVRGWKGSTCSGTWEYQFTFSDSLLSWMPSSPGIYSFRVDCLGKTSDCTQINVKSPATTILTTTTSISSSTTTSINQTTSTSSTTTTATSSTTTIYRTTSTTTSTETTETETETTTNEFGNKNTSSDNSLIIVMIVLIVVLIVIFFIYYRKKQYKWQGLYSKWKRWQ